MSSNADIARYALTHGITYEKARAPETVGTFATRHIGDADIQKQLTSMTARGIKDYQWHSHPGCEHCAPNNGATRAVGK